MPFGAAFTFLVCFLFSAMAVFLWKRRYLYYHASKVKGPFSFPLLGSTWIFLGETHDMLEGAMKLTRSYSDAPLFRFWLGPELVFVIKEPRYIEILLNRFLERPPNYRFLEMVFGDGLFTTGVEKWRRHRKVIALTFNQKILDSFMDIFVKHSKLLAEVLSSKTSEHQFDIFPIMSQCTLDFICETTMGTKVNAMSENSQYGDLTSKGMELTSHRLFKPWLHPDFFWELTSMSKEIRFLSEKLKTYAKKVIDGKRKEKSNVCKTSEKRKIFLDHMIDLTDEFGKWSDEELIEETRTVIIAGCDATALQSSFVMLMLGMHQDIQERVYEEINAVFDGDDRDPTVEDLSRMTYLELCIKETLRLFPVGSIIGRSVTDDVILDDRITIPKGSLFSVVVLHLHRDPKLWKDPLEFVPERFLPEESAKRHPYAYIPFSGGPRNCIGFRYAMIALKTVLSTLVRKYKFTSPRFKKVEDVKLKMEVSTKCCGGCTVAIQNRNNIIKI